jgi:hypothetical protein
MMRELTACPATLTVAAADTPIQQAKLIENRVLLVLASGIDKTSLAGAAKRPRCKVPGIRDSHVFRDSTNLDRDFQRATLQDV